MGDMSLNRPLIGFTVLGPASVGALGGVVVLGRGAPDTYLSVGALGAFLLAVAAVLFSLAHLDKPTKAYRAARRFPTSPLSREIASFAGFTGAVAAYTVATLAGARPLWLGVASVMLGALAVVATAQVYLVPGRPAWRHWSTLAGFAGSTLSLGPALALALAAARWPSLLQGDAADALRTLTTSGVALSAVAFWSRSTHRNRVMSGAGNGPTSVFADPLGLWVTRVVVGILIPPAVLILSPTSAPVVGLAALALVAGETADRTLFFAGNVARPIGSEIPGAR
ncbi:MAG: dimethyl sulfoxide reductase anchor subunit family protein [Thermoleophilia bacterium]